MQTQAGRAFDVVVVGSGASGGWAAKRLAEAGVNVAMLDAGRVLTPADYKEHVPAHALKYRNKAGEIIRRTRPVQKDLYACGEWNYDWFRNDLEEPYTLGKDAAGREKPFSWQGRMQVVGGRTNVWGRQSYRLSDLDFKAASHDGFGEDWPLGYDDLAPYYDIVEEYVGITGLPEGVYELPDGKFHPPMGMRCVERHVRARVKQKLGWTVTLGRSANITKAINGRQPCHYCGPCERGCVSKSYFNSAFTTVADALATGKCTLIPNAMVYKVLMDPVSHKANGVLYIDRVTRQPQEVRAKAVVLSAQALESVRIMLNSATEQAPAGLGNSSGALGHYLMDHLWVAGGASGEFPEMASYEKVTASMPQRPDGTYVIRFRNTKKGPQDKRFLRGYGFQGGGSSSFNWRAPGFGAAFKEAMRQPVIRFGLAGFGECLPYYENYVEIDRNVSDVFGIPVLKIHMTWGENERKMVPDMMESAAEMMEAAGGKDIRPFQVLDRIPGYGIHEIGVARMGKNPKTSVLNQFQQCHDVSNLFVMDGAGFTSGACQNPTLTIMALTVRSTDYLLGELKRGTL
jgi:glucoside 3-dehydrogenase (cytochrome c) catalytic subunit